MPDGKSLVVWIVMLANRGQMAFGVQSVESMKLVVDGPRQLVDRVKPCQTLLARVDG